MSGAATHWDGGCYGAHSAVQSGIALAALASQRFGGGERLLDVGCGDGKLSAELATRVPEGEVVAVDSSASMLEHARRNFGARPRLTFLLADAQQLPFEREFDFAFSAFCLQWVPDKRAAFRSLARALKPGGRALLVMPFRSPEVAAIRTSLSGDARWRRYFTGYRDPTDALVDVAYADYAGAAGLTVEASSVASTTADFPTRGAFRSFLEALTPHLVCLPEPSARSEFLDALVGRYCEQVPARAGAAATYVYVCTTVSARMPA